MMMRAWILPLLAILALAGCQSVPPARGFTATQQTELRAQGFVETGESWELSMADRLLFDTDSADIRSDMHAALDRIAAGLLRVGITAARVEGHTDSTGNSDHNARLSSARAAAVANALLQRGFLRHRVVEHSWGETRPIADNALDSGRSLNRRVVIIVSPE
jgi:OOP family OmpA-OmpF porin